MPLYSMMSPFKTAALMVAAVKQYGDEKGKRISRARISRPSVSYLSDRRILTGAFISQVAEETAALGWNLLELQDGGFGLIRTDTTESWTKIAVRPRVDELYTALISGDVSEGELEIEGYLDRPDDEELRAKLAEMAALLALRKTSVAPQSTDQSSEDE